MLSIQDQQTVYEIVTKAVRDAMNDYRKEQSQKTESIKQRRVDNKQDRVLQILKSAKRYTRDTRFDPIVFRKGWMYHSKLLKLSGFTADEFANVMKTLTQAGAVTIVPVEDVIALGILNKTTIYAMGTAQYP